jgi:glycosyltransferase involved in cell wall biosynthesis
VSGPVRVLAVAQSAALGGAEYGLLRVARRLPAHGYEVEIASPGEGPLEEAAGQAGIPTHRLAVGGLHAGDWPRALASLPRARALLRRGGFALAWLNGTVAQRLAPGLAAGTLVPHVHDLLDRAPLPWRSARFWSRAPVVLCDSTAVAERSRALGAPADRLRVVGCPVDPVEPAQRPAWADSRPTIGFVGRLEARKAPLDLLRALPSVAERVPSVRLVLVGQEELRGSASYAGEVRAEATRQGDRVLTLGGVADASRLMPWFDVLAVPSLIEPFGTVAAEALAAGTPVVATRSGGMEEYVTDGEVGALVPPGDPAALADALARVLPRSAELADACRAAAAPFASERVAGAVAEALGEALHRGSAVSSRERD